MIGDTEPLGKTILKHRGNLNIKLLYSSIKDWFDSKSYDYTERNYTKDSKPTGDEYVIEVDGEREIDGYVKFKINVEIFTPYVNKGESSIRIKIEPVVMLDYKKYFDKNKFTKFLKYVYNNYIIKRKIKSYYEGKLYMEFLELSTKIKEVLNQYD